VFFLGDKTKNPQTIIGKWKHIKTQTIEELDQLIEDTQKRTDVEAWNWGIRTGINDISCLDFDWEFLYYGWLRKFGDRAKTVTYRTANKGYRVIFKTTERENSNPYKTKLHIEFENKGYAVIGGYAEDKEGYKQEYLKLSNLTLYDNENHNFPNTIATDNYLIADTKLWLKEQLKQYDFLQYRCIYNLTNKKHIKLNHEQRLAILTFMILKDFTDEEIHDFFRTIYDDSGRDYKKDVTQAQIKSGKDYKEKGGKPHPCKLKQQDNGHVSIPLYQIFGYDKELCVGCLRKQHTPELLEDEEKFDMVEALDLVNKGNKFICPTDTETLYMYNTKTYEPCESTIRALLEEKYWKIIKSYDVEEVIKHLQRQNYVDRKEINQYTNSIPLLNGMFNLSTKTLEKHNNKNYLTYCYNVEYNQKADCPEWKKFVAQILPDEKDRMLLQEIMGYCLLPAMPYHKIFWFHGKGRNGKGRVIATLEYIIGKENCSSLNVSDFSETRRFSLCQLIGKLLNVSSEPSVSKYGIQTNVLKKLSGEDMIDAEIKGSNTRLRFMNFAKPIIIGNNFPKTNDNTTAWWDRNECLKFPKEFIGEDKIINIEKKWLPTEVNGIFNWMLEGLYRVYQQNDFTKSKNAMETKIEYMKLSDPFNAWLLDCIEFNPNAYLLREEAHENYKTYCFEIGAAPITKTQFFGSLRDTPRVSDVAKKVKGKTERVFVGITIKTKVEEGLDDNLIENFFDTSEKVAKVAEVTELHTPNIVAKQKNNNMCTKKEVTKPATCATSATSEDETELGKMEYLKNWIRATRVNNILTLEDIRNKITELKFLSDIKEITKRLCDEGDLVGVDF